MDYSAMLCICSASAPFVAVMRDVCLNRRPWFTWTLVILASAFAVMVSVAFLYTRASDELCFEYTDVVDRLRQCSAEQDYDDSCCQQVEADVSAACGWNDSRAEFCLEFWEITLDYCRVNYCPFFLNGTAALPPNATSGSVLDS